MVLFFSGTGNSEYAAKRIAKRINDETLDLFDKIRKSDLSPLRSKNPWVLVTPVYAWRIPRVVHRWLERVTLSGNKSIYFVITCGGGCGNAGKYLKKLCAKKGLIFMGCQEVVMPENYIALFCAPEKEQALKIITRAESVIEKAARFILVNETFLSSPPTMADRLLSGAVNKLFYPLYVHAKKFYATDACVNCGKCATGCPLNNIRLENGKPVWGKSCTHCMACIARCPKAAIEYGKHTINLTRYVCPKKE